MLHELTLARLPTTPTTSDTTSSGRYRITDRHGVGDHTSQRYRNRSKGTVQTTCRHLGAFHASVGEPRSYTGQSRKPQRAPVVYAANPTSVKGNCAYDLLALRCLTRVSRGEPRSYVGQLLTQFAWKPRLRHGYAGDLPRFESPAARKSKSNV